jgi:transposase-like protein
MQMNLGELVEQFGSNDRCRDYLEALRWPDGVECPACGSKSVSRLVKRKQFDCNSCRKRFSVLAGTVLQDSKLPLWKWFAAVYLMCESKKGVSALQVQRMLNLKSYESAWYLCHRIRSAMDDGDAPLLSGVVEADETYIGGKVRGRGRGYRDNKTVVLGAIQRGGPLRVRTAENNSRPVLHQFLGETVADEAEAIYTDEWTGYRGIGDHNTRHETVAHGSDEYVRGDIHTNTVESAWSLFDRAVIGSYHQLSKKHLDAYLGEFEFRFNNRDNPHLFRDTILRLVKADALTYERLTQSAHA